MKPPARFRIPVRPAPSKDRLPGKWLVTRGADCINCGRCIQACLYGVHAKRPEDPRRMAEPESALCRNCFKCVMECPVETLDVDLNPEFESFGWGPYNADVIRAIRQQAEDGRIPVSGGGYKGRFAGKGFDGIWTDMSEIVRPTRDGIHGREAISTCVEIGRVPLRLEFDGGELVTPVDPPLEVPLPILFEPPEGEFREEDLVAIVEAARRIGTVCVLRPRRAERFEGITSSIVPIVDPDADLPEGSYPMIEVRDPAPDRIGELRRRTRIAARFACGGSAPERAVEYARAGVDAVHVHGITDPKQIRALHQALVRSGLRDAVTLIVSGDIAMAEHVPKAILCGADVVAVSWPLMIALGCRACHPGCGECPGTHGDRDWAVQRLLNLMAAWRDQLLEVLGAMGIRDVRRLRGEIGRAMFYEDLEAEFREAIANPVPLKVGQNRQAFLSQPEPSPAPRSFKNMPGLWRVNREDTCISCGVCVETCPYGVHLKPPGFRRPLPPRSERCIGKRCEREEFYCISKCPVDALSLEPGPASRSLGDARWPARLIVATWEQAETGEPPGSGLEYRVGDSGGGFDRLDLKFSRPLPEKPDPTIGTDIDLNRRPEGERITIPIPWYLSGMSFGAIGISTMLSRVRAARRWKTFMSTGEGGYPEALRPYDDWVCTQIATGLFGVREDTIRRVRLVEFKYAQGAKPGLGGHLLGNKNTPVVARLREAVEGTSLFSPFPFHSVYSVEDHRKHVDWVRSVNPRALVAVKVSTPADVDMVAIGSYYAGANILQIDGGYGGTAAAPDIAKKNIAMPIEFAIPKVHRYLMKEGVREEIVILASGGIRTAWDIAKAIALGADGVVLGTSELVAINCVRCGNCERGRGCPVGIASTDPELSAHVRIEWGEDRLSNLFRAYRIELQRILQALGLRHIRELVGRSDLLEVRE